MGGKDPLEREIGNGNPLQYSCLQNPMDRGAWRATVLRVTRSQTQLKRLSMHELHLHVKIITERSRLDTSAKGKLTDTVYPCGPRKKKRAVVMMVTVVSLFAVCWAPFHIVHMMMEYSE